MGESLTMANEITVRMKCSTQEMCEILENKEFKVKEKFFLDDTYFLPGCINLNKKSEREILAQAILLRNISEEFPNKQSIYKITYKKKEINEKRRNIKSE